jgi:phage terminase small subunit
LPVLTNQRHEAFCTAIAKGKSASEAYAEAGYAYNEGNAVRLKGNEKVRARIAELQGKAAARVEITLEKLLRDLEETKAAAKRDRQHAAAARCTELQAKLTGLLTEKREVVTKTQPSGPELDFSKFTEADWAVLESLRPMFEKARIRSETQH